MLISDQQCHLAGLADPNDMRRLMAAFAGHQGELRTQAFVYEEFRHAAGGVRRSFLCVRTVTSGGGAVRRRGCPRCWLAPAYIVASSTCSRCRLGVGRKNPIDWNARCDGSGHIVDRNTSAANDRRSTQNLRISDLGDGATLLMPPSKCFGTGRKYALNLL